MSDERLRAARPAAHNAIDFGKPPSAPFLVVYSDHGDTQAIRDAVLGAIRAALSTPDPAPTVGMSDERLRAVLDADDFRDRHERVVRDHILDSDDDHRCDDLCSAAIIDRLVGKKPLNEYPSQPHIKHVVHAQRAATDAATRALNHLQVGVSNGITPDAVKRVLISAWPESTIPDLTDMARAVCVAIHGLIVATGHEQAPLAALSPDPAPVGLDVATADELMVQVEALMDDHGTRSIHLDDLRAVVNEMVGAKR